MLTTLLNVSFPNFLTYLTVPGLQNILNKFKYRILTSEVSQDIVLDFRQTFLEKSDNTIIVL